MSKLKTIFFVLLALALSSTVFFVGYHKTRTPKTIYKVYLDGKAIGLIDSKEALEAYIDQEQNEIKDKYDVDKVYLPNNLDIEKETTYSDNIDSVSDIYEKIKDIAPFTISGYEIKIKGVKEIIEETDEEVTKETIKINVLDKDLFTESVEETVRAFVEDEKYDAYKNNDQPEIVDVGSIVENVYIQNDITIKKVNISVEDKIFTDVNELSQYLLFGNLDEKSSYKVKTGETIDDIAFNHKMSTNEFLVANPNIPSANVLLSAGENVNISTIDPAVKVIEEDYIVENQYTNYGITYEYDNNLAKGTEKVKQNGVNGIEKVTYHVKKSNREIISTETIATEVVKKPVNKIIVKGTKVIPKPIPNGGNVTASGTWFWPTEKHQINSHYGWRGSKLHEGTDIGGTSGSKIFAANSGVVVESRLDPKSAGGKRAGNGQYIFIDHKNGYYSTYSHLTKRYVEVGDVVEIGQVIGTMGQTGNATGPHLHFSIWKGYPHRSGSTSINPEKVKYQ